MAYVVGVDAGGRVEGSPLGRFTAVSDSGTPAGALASHPEAWRYVALGDTFAARDPETSAISWTDSVVAALRHVNPSVLCHTLARRGATSAHLADVQVANAIRLRPHVVTISCGADEVLAAAPFDFGSYACHLSMALRTLRRELPAAVIVTATYADFVRFVELPRPSRGQLGCALRHLNTAIRSLARRHRVACVDLALDRVIWTDAESPSDVWQRQNNLVSTTVLDAVAGRVL